MTTANLLELALVAIEEDDAMVVLTDRLLELEWYDERVISVVLLPMPPSRSPGTQEQRKTRKRTRELLQSKGRETFGNLLASAQSRQIAKAVAAVLLFGDWRKRPWPVWYRHRKDGTSERLASAELLRKLDESVVLRVQMWPAGG